MSRDSPYLRPYSDVMSLAKFHSRRAAPWTALLLSGGLLCGAWFFQYVLNYSPCQMCYWQRHAHKGVLGVAALWLLLRKLGVEAAEILRWAAVIALLISFGLAAWHAGVEWGWVEAPKTCTAGGGQLQTSCPPENPLCFLDKSIKPPACSEAVWHFLGLSMAGWNALLSLIGAGLIGTARVATSKTI